MIDSLKKELTGFEKVKKRDKNYLILIRLSTNSLAKIKEKRKRDE
jgi:hypothetical protein